MVSSQTFDNTGSPYNVSRIINDDVTFNIDAYKDYSPVFIPVSFAISYGLSFAAVSSTITHTLIYNRKRIWNRACQQPDIQARLMSVYKEVPDWWYLIILCAFNRLQSPLYTLTTFEGTMFIFGVAAIEIWHTDLPIWAFILALIIGASLNSPL
jgi:hypothetical protein